MSASFSLFPVTLSFLSFKISFSSLCSHLSSPNSPESARTPLKPRLHPPILITTASAIYLMRASGCLDRTASRLEALWRIRCGTSTESLSTTVKTISDRKKQGTNSAGATIATVEEYDEDTSPGSNAFVFDLDDDLSITQTASSSTALNSSSHQQGTMGSPTPFGKPSSRLNTTSTTTSDPPLAWIWQPITSLPILALAVKECSGYSMAEDYAASVEAHFASSAGLEVNFPIYYCFDGFTPHIVTLALISMFFINTPSFQTHIFLHFSHIPLFTLLYLPFRHLVPLCLLLLGPLLRF